MNIENKELQTLLDQAQVIIRNDQEQKADQETKGEGFDIFQILQFSRYEEQLHTPMIRMLLDKDCNHGLKDAFLKAFMDKVIKKFDKSFEFETSSSCVLHQDKFIGEIQNDDNGTSTGGKIDIFLYDGKKHAIIIENKFNGYGYSAQDQPKQLERYYNYGKENYEGNFILVYLTPDGHQASEYSTGTNRFKYITLSYVPNGDGPSILSWLEECLKISSNQPRIHEVIKQYITYIKTITGVMEENNQLIDLLTKSENIETALTIIGYQDAIKKNIREEFCHDLIKTASKYGLTLLPGNKDSWDGYKKLTEWDDANGWLIFQGEKKQHPQVCFTIGRYKDSGIIYGLTNISGYELEEKVKEDFKWKSQDENKLPVKSAEEVEEKWNKDFPFGYSYLSADRNPNVEWGNWDNSQTLIDMKNGKLLKFIEERFKIFKELGVFDKL